MFTPAQEAAAVAAYGARASTAAYRAAELAVGIAISRSGREKERDAVGGPLLQIVRLDSIDLHSSADAAANAATLSPSAPNEGVVSSEPLHAPAPALRPIAEPALAAILAVMMADVLSRDQVVELYASFESVIPQSTLH